jgi:predicted O-methyltransferase YrrM
MNSGTSATHVITALRRLLGLQPLTHLNLRWVKRGGWLGRHLIANIPHAPRKQEIETAAHATNTLGPQHLAAEYGEAGATRTPDGVRSSAYAGDLYAWLVQQRRPAIVVEFGSAFGVSGMYFCAGLESSQTGHLYTFEINREWADIAERNIRTLSNRVTLTRAAFEDEVAAVVRAPIDLALVDGIHTYEFVMRQFAILKPRMSRGGLIAFDDIDFAKPGTRMHEAWTDIAASNEIVAAVEIQGRLGLVELGL